MTTVRPTARSPVRPPAPRPQRIDSGARSLIRIPSFQGVRMTVSPSSALYLICGTTGAGKSSLLHDNPDAFVLNLDPSPTPYTPKARILPGVRRDKRPVLPNPSAPDDPEQGTPMELSWEWALSIKETLVDMALKDEPRPSLIVMDTTDAAVELVKKWYLAKWNSDHPEKQYEDFNDIHGKLSGPALNRAIIDFGMDLNRVGYGFAWLCRAGNKTIYLNDTDKEYREGTWLIKESLWNALIGSCELIGFVEQMTMPEIISVDRKDHSGKVVGKVNRTIHKSSVTISFTPNAQNNQAKSRYAGIESPITIPVNGKWNAVASAIQKCIDANL